MLNQRRISHQHLRPSPLTTTMTTKTAKLTQDGQTERQIKKRPKRNARHTLRRAVKILGRRFLQCWRAVSMTMGNRIAFSEISTAKQTPRFLSCRVKKNGRGGGGEKGEDESGGIPHSSTATHTIPDRMCSPDEDRSYNCGMTECPPSRPREPASV